MVVFLDTSSLLKRYVEERGSDQVDRFFVSGNAICISPITPIEMYSALCRKVADRSIDQETFDKAQRYWGQDIRHYSIVPFSEILVERAISIIEAHNIRTLDSIQIASASLSDPDTCIRSDNAMSKVLEKVLVGRTLVV
ncbi:MAG TPA: type II toxin-antitoxin system VapC family toxin [Spirochaetota bacterium]|nr:type II toxin-antitoxin system VapC family toxin [Spirochaetota bacterium]HNT11174.1 type II toxin-antitoxin system VapC family toxin [Spirochaetota bacterium]HOS40166.1 type II toxin-antitoxin system VapC family toxin [Spirochaetota bacterium]